MSVSPEEVLYTESQHPLKKDIISNVLFREFVFHLFLITHNFQITHNFLIMHSRVCCIPMKTSGGLLFLNEDAFNFGAINFGDNIFGGINFGEISTIHRISIEISGH